MTMGNDDNWSNLPAELLTVIVHRLSFLEEYFRCTAVCKSWWKAASDSEKPWLPTSRYPLLLLAEEASPEAIPSDCEYDSTEDYGDTDTDDLEDNDNEEEEDSDDEEEEDDNIRRHQIQLVYQQEQERYEHLKNSIGSSRGLYSLSSMKTYDIELPEAAGRLILGTNKGWLVTLGRDLKINLLHPLLRHQISLPPMLTFPRQYDYYGNYHPEEDSDMFIRKVAISSKILNKKKAGSFYHHHASPSPIVMAIYGECGFLGFARLGDKVWTDVNNSRSLEDIIYHKGNFYAVANSGDVYVCGIDDDEERGGPRSTKIASLKADQTDQKYLVESLSGSGLLLILRYNKIKYFDLGGRWPKYRTTHFSVWRLDLTYSDSLDIPLCTLTEVNNLGNEAIFVGKASSVSISSSEIIKPNCIYFTDDNWVTYLRCGGGHDMGIFDMERRIIEPHFQGKSIHPFSPPLWYI